ncbi:phenylalanine--tRNA ligase subunit alpha [Holzapfeliella floricola]|uniref:Phenylalanine--tRNA ligase alpha subunit n=2 Tax=Holzapfeliella TaxID=2767883 RepID=A0A0R2DTW8_9LACO|nr:phenylalanine--tRNA ligase subunit alpha [Holzapfeliella floricola]KRN03882.1 phenylalanyl-tRNA synthetase, alpha subunit [Holzapfeliella floricola DSM 23037 = JCM 16512]
MSVFDHIQTLKDQGLTQIKEANDLDTLNNIRVNLTGKKGELTKVLRSMKDLSNEERPKVGQVVNEVRDLFATEIDNKKEQLQQAELEAQMQKEAIDVTLPGKESYLGSHHLINIVRQDIEEFCVSLGYQVITGPEVESDHYNFEMMNIPKNHPARDMQDTFYVDATHEHLMRSQTSPVQARTLEKHDFSKSPLKMISPGKVYRRDDDDATHSHQFNQLEGLVIDENITMAHLKGTLQAIAQHVFGEDREIRLRPSYFPFTEPSVEVDVTCFACGGKGCSTCKSTGWIEVLGAGMVHPNVLENAGVDSQKYGGFAFGLGLDRFAILKYGVSDIRDFYLNDVRFLEQFRQEAK